MSESIDRPDHKKTKSKRWFLEWIFSWLLILTLIQDANAWVIVKNNPDINRDTINIKSQAQSDLEQLIYKLDSYKSVFPVLKEKWYDIFVLGSYFDEVKKYANDNLDLRKLSELTKLIQYISKITIKFDDRKLAYNITNTLDLIVSNILILHSSK